MYRWSCGADFLCIRLLVQTPGKSVLVIEIHIRSEKWNTYTSLNLAMFLTFSRDRDASDVTLLADELTGRLFSTQYTPRGELGTLFVSRCCCCGGNWLLIVGVGTEMSGGCEKCSPVSVLYRTLERGEEELFSWKIKENLG